MMPECTLDDKDPLSLYLKKAPMVQNINVETKFNGHSMLVTKNDNHTQVVEPSENTKNSKCQILSDKSISKDVSDRKKLN